MKHEVAEKAAERVEPKKRATVSVALIVRDEAGTLQPCLESIKNLVDEIVVLVDDRTTDNSFEIAKQYATFVEEFTWKDDFAGARNKAISYCTSEWILIMDGHEVLHPKSYPVLTNVLERVLPGGDLASTGRFDAFVYMDPKGIDIDHMVPKTFFLQPRLFLREKYHYKGRVHNYIVANDEEVKKRDIRPVNELVFVHHRSEEQDAFRKAERRENNIRILQEDVKEDPKNPRPYFYIAQTYYEVDEYDKALVAYQQYLDRSRWKPERAHALLMMATIYAEKKEYVTAIDCCMKGIEEDWERPELYLTLGDIAYDRKDFYQAQHWYSAAKEMKPPMNGMFLHGAAYTYAPYVKLAKLASTVGEWMEALQNAEKALELGADEPDMTEKMLVWKTHLGLKPGCTNVALYDENNEFTFLQGIRTRLSEGKYNVATSVNYDLEQAKWADIIWIEWCARNVTGMALLPKPEHQKWVVRLHGYEVFSKSRITTINWSKIDVLIFVADHVRKKFMEKYWIADSVKVLTIPNGVDIKRWSFAKREYSSSKNIGVIGILTEKKGPLLLAKVIRHFAKRHSEWKFLLRLDVLNDPDVNEQVLQYELRDLDNWEWVPRQASLNAWMEDLKFLISTSVLESFSYVVAEAMAKGIKPLIHDFQGSRELWPEELIWRDISELDALLDSSYRSDAYRQWVQDHYSLDMQMQRIDTLFQELVAPKKEVPKIPEMSPRGGSGMKTVDGVQMISDPGNRG